jgi:hypothetical protein
MKKLAYVGPEGGGVRLEGGFLLPHGETVAVTDALHEEFLTRRAKEFEDREVPPINYPKPEPAPADADPAPADPASGEGGKG